MSMHSKRSRATSFILSAQDTAGTYFWVLAFVFLRLILIYLAVVFSKAVIPLWENAHSLLLVMDKYTSLALSSMPISLLIIGLTLLITQRDSIDEFIRKRMTKAGPGGVEGVLNPQEAQAELNAASGENQSIDTNESVISGAQIDEHQIATNTEDNSVIAPTTSGENSDPVNQTVQIQELNKELMLERIYNSIFGTQISILVWLRNNLTGLWYAAFASVYEQWRATDEILKTYPLDSYINFLISNKLIYSIEEGGVRKFIIADLGIDFLNFIERRGYSQYKPH